jgi:hypothetical protein
MSQEVLALVCSKPQVLEGIKCWRFAEPSWLARPGCRSSSWPVLAGQRPGAPTQPPTVFRRQTQWAGRMLTQRWCGELSHTLCWQDCMGVDERYRPTARGRELWAEGIAFISTLRYWTRKVPITLSQIDRRLDTVAAEHHSHWKIRKSEAKELSWLSKGTASQSMRSQPTAVTLVSHSTHSEVVSETPPTSLRGVGISFSDNRQLRNMRALSSLSVWTPGVGRRILTSLSSTQAQDRDLLSERPVPEKGPWVSPWQTYALSEPGARVHRSLSPECSSHSVSRAVSGASPMTARILQTLDTQWTV